MALVSSENFPSPESRGLRERLARAFLLSGAGLQGNLAQAQQSLFAQDLAESQEQRAQQNEILRNTAIDARRVRGLLQNNQPEAAQELLNQRATRLNSLGVDSSDTQNILALLREGTPSSIQQALGLVTEADQAAVSAGFIDPDPRFAEATVSEELRGQELQIRQAQLLSRLQEQGLRQSEIEQAFPGFQASVALAREAAVQGARRINEAVPEAREALQVARNANDQLKLIDQGIRSGSRAAVRNNAARVFGTFLGIPDDQIEATDEFLARSGLNVARQISSFGAGTGLSDADREFASRIVGGQLELTEGAIRNLVRIQRDLSVEAIRNFNRDVEQLRGVADEKTRGILPRLVELPDFAQSVSSATSPASPQASSGSSLQDIIDRNRPGGG